MSKKKIFSLEFNFHCSPQLLFQYLSTPSGLSEWFADDVNSRGEDFTFIWEDSEEYAKLLTKKIMNQLNLCGLTMRKIIKNIFLNF